jgi:hypothetical protein
MSDLEIIPEKAKKLFRRMLEAREEADRLDKATKDAKKEAADLEQEVHQALVESVGSSAIPVDLGPPYGRIRLQPVSTTYGNVLNEDKLVAHLQETGQMDAYTRPSLAKGELNKLARQLREGNESFPPGFDYYEKRYVRVTIPKAS